MRRALTLLIRLLFQRRFASAAGLDALIAPHPRTPNVPPVIHRAPMRGAPPPPSPPRYRDDLPSETAPGSARWDVLLPD